MRRSSPSSPPTCGHERPPGLATPECFVVLRGPTTGAPVTEAGLRSLFRRHRELSGATRVRPHRLRHTYGTELAAAGIDLLALRELMGHASPETTARYVHLSIEHLAAEYAAARATLAGCAVTAAVARPTPTADDGWWPTISTTRHAWASATGRCGTGSDRPRLPAARHPDLHAWMTLPAVDRIAELRRHRGVAADRVTRSAPAGYGSTSSWPPSNT